MVSIKSSKQFETVQGEILEKYQENLENLKSNLRVSWGLYKKHESKILLKYVLDIEWKLETNLRKIKRRKIGENFLT